MKKRMSSMMLAAVLLAGMLAGCSGGGTPSGAASSTAGSSSSKASSAGSQAAPEKLVEISQLVWDRGTIPADQGTLEQNWWVDFVNEQVAPLGVKVNYVMIPRAQEAELLSTMLAAQNAPDICKTNEKPLVKTYVSGGGVADITDYVAQHGENIRKLYSETELMDGQVDGRQYTIYHKNNGFARATWIRKDWLDKLNLPVPQGPEEYKAMLKAMKEQDPGGIGSALMPMAFSSQKFSYWDIVVMPAFTEEAPTPEKMLLPSIMWPEAKDTLRYLNELYLEGLLGEFILDKDESLIRQKIARGELATVVIAGHYMYHSAYGNLYDKLRDNQPEAEMISIWPWVNSKGDNFKNFYEKPPQLEYQWFIPTSSKNIEAAVKYLDWMCSSDAYETACLGIEGQDYSFVDNVPTVTDTDKYLARVPWIEPQYGVTAKPYPNASEKDLFLKNYTKDFNPAYYPEIEANVLLLSDVNYYKPNISLPTPISDKVQSTLQQKLDDNMAKIVCAPAGQFDKVFDDFVADYAKSGGQESYDELVAAYKQLHG